MRVFVVNAYENRKYKYDEERYELRQKYRFDPYRPGYYHGIREIGAIVLGRTRSGVSGYV